MEARKLYIITRSTCQQTKNNFVCVACLPPPFLLKKNKKTQILKPKKIQWILFLSIFFWPLELFCERQKQWINWLRAEAIIGARE